MASDAPSLARWWRAFCAGEIVSQASLTEMTTMQRVRTGAVRARPTRDLGHGGEGIGYVSFAGWHAGVWRRRRGAHSNQMIDTSPVAASLMNAVLAD